MKLAVPAAFGRLCVETNWKKHPYVSVRPAAFGRLCVETSIPEDLIKHIVTSRLRAAVC